MQMEEGRTMIRLHLNTLELCLRKGSVFVPFSVVPDVYLRSVEQTDQLIQLAFSFNNLHKAISSLSDVQ